MLLTESCSRRRYLSSIPENNLWSRPILSSKHLTKGPLNPTLERNRKRKRSAYSRENEMRYWTGVCFDFTLHVRFCGRLKIHIMNGRKVNVHGSIRHLGDWVPPIFVVTGFTSTRLLRILLNKRVCQLFFDQNLCLFNLPSKWRLLWMFEDFFNKIFTELSSPFFLYTLLNF